MFPSDTSGPIPPRPISLVNWPRLIASACLVIVVAGWLFQIDTRDGWLLGAFFVWASIGHEVGRIRRLLRGLPAGTTDRMVRDYFAGDSARKWYPTESLIRDFDLVFAARQEPRSGNSPECRQP
ncbi:hypothetical protein [Luteolibacter marinus]|uniref:hypothetical protein n=1 Tax=Luteolibacter marinus TaxID=2776705 RepID=UPI001866F9E4|nr:hypothetical protein [Luteolibacter marinus]